jgi:hypothetical protein
MLVSTLSTQRPPRQKSAHPAFAPGNGFLLRACPSSGHVELEGQTVDQVLGVALANLDRRQDTTARQLLDSQTQEQRLVIALAVVGQALRVPVRVRAGACDRKGLDAPGNALGQLLATLSGRLLPYTGRRPLQVVAEARATAALVRAANVSNQRWIETKRNGQTVERKRRFLRSWLYASAAALRAWYRHASLSSLVHEVARLAPGAWRVAARAKRGARGYWGAIRRSRNDLVQAAKAQSRRRAFERFKRRFQTIKTKRENSPTTDTSKAPKPVQLRPDPGRAGQGEACQGSVVDSRPQSFIDRIAVELGLDHGLLRGLR